ncbi:MAG: sigma 54-interacting transcriptional regulator [Deltaproteobacteria bacterium]|nr:sigma 54-interacting transcriptional regulator [Deltaproteobacteria bacterium]
MAQDRRFKFALVGHSLELAKAVKAYSDPGSEDLVSRVVNLDEAVPVAKELLGEGIEVILGHGGTGNLIFQNIVQQSVKIPRSRLDLILAFMKAREYGREIGLTSFSKPIDGIDIIENLLDIKVHQLIFNSGKDLEEAVYSAYCKNIKVVVGGGISRTLINSFGGKGILVLPRESVVKEALEEARAIALVRRRDAINAERIRTILQMTEEGVIGIDQYGRIDICNETAEEILGIKFEKAKGKLLSGVFKDFSLIDVLRSNSPNVDTIKKVGGKNVLINTLPLRIAGKGSGAVAFLREVERIENINRKVRENLYAKGFVARHFFKDIKGCSPKTVQLIQEAKRYAETDATIMIQGETGTGKGLLAEAIHNSSARRKEPFVAVNCPALPESLLESELFGYEEGAFTGARKGGKIGLFELANKGTVFLDEIADMPQTLQVRLLRVLEAKEVMRVGGDRYVPTDVRIIGSSNKDLRRETKDSRFRADLYFRFTILKLKLPPLRDRIEDIHLILEKTLNKYGQRGQCLTPHMLEKLNSYSWPGNIRELISFIESYFILLGDSSEPNEGLFYHLFQEYTEVDINRAEEASDDYGKTAPDIPRRNLKSELYEYEKLLIYKTLQACQYNKKRTAKSLGISVNTLWRKLQS